jgi:hypothetical protein
MENQKESKSIKIFQFDKIVAFRAGIAGYFKSLIEWFPNNISLREIN